MILNNILFYDGALGGDVNLWILYIHVPRLYD